MPFTLMKAKQIAELPTRTTSRGLLRFTLCLWATMLSLSAQEPAASEPESTSDDVVSRVTYDLGDRTVTLLQVSKATIPSPLPKTDAPATQQRLPEEQAAWEAWVAQQPKRKHLSLGGTVYCSAAHPPRSLICGFGNNGTPPVVFWSSIDWQLLQPGNFTLPDGTKLNLLLLLSVHDEDKMAAFHQRWGGTYTPIAIPTFPAGPATFRIISGAPTPEQLADLQQLHALHDRKYAALLSAFEQRQAAQLVARQINATQEAKPPQDVVIRYRVMTPDELENR